MRFQLLSLSALVLLLCLTIASFLLNLDFLTREDGIIEYAAALFWLFGIILSIVLIKRNSNRKLLVFVLLLVCFVSLGEEISWGQRILNIETPESIAAANKQSELNFHNLYFFSGGSCWLNFFETGQFSFYLLLDMQNLFRTGFVLLFFIFPFVNKTTQGKELLSKIGYFYPGSIFTFSALFFFIASCILTFFANPVLMHSLQEIRETAFALIILLYLFSFFYREKTSYL
jgi:hypothetical protein